MVSICRRDLLSYHILNYAKPADLYTKTKQASSSSRTVIVVPASDDWRTSNQSLKSDADDKKSPKDMSVTACIRREAFSLLNKLTRENFHSVSKKFCELSVTTPEGMAEVSDMIFNKAVLEHSYSETYADLILLLHQSYPGFPGKQGRTRTTFASTLLNKCQREFIEIPPTLQEKDIKNRQSHDSTSTTASKEDIENAITCLKKRLSGLMKFIAHLYLRDMLSNKIIREVGLHLVFQQQYPEEHYVEWFCVLLKHIGATLDSTATGSDYMNTFYIRLEELSNSGQYSTRIRFFITDLTELRENKWMDTRAPAQVQTKEAVRARMEAHKGEQDVFVKKVAGARPAYIQQQIAKAAAEKVFEYEKINQLADYFCQDASKEAALSDWIGLELDQPGNEKATSTLLKRAYVYPKKADNILELLKVLNEYITGEVLAQAIHSAKTDYEDALVDNPNAACFHQSVLEYKDTLREFTPVKNKKKKKRSSKSSP